MSTLIFKWLKHVVQGYYCCLALLSYLFQWVQDKNSISYLLQKKERKRCRERPFQYYGQRHNFSPTYSFINLFPFLVLLLLTVSDVTEPCCLFRLVTKSKRAKRNFATLRWLDLIVITFSNGYSSLEMSLPLGCFVPVTKYNHNMMTDIPCYAPVSNM